MFKKNKNGFTLIELLVVCTIIAVLAVVATISYKNAKIQSRDARRKSDMDAIAKALELYYDKNNTYKVVDNTTATGNSGTGSGYFNYGGPNYSYSESISQGLINAGFLSNDISDPSGQTTYGNNQSGYMLGLNVVLDKASIQCQLENSSSSDLSTTSSTNYIGKGNSDCCSGQDFTTIYRQNYAVNIVP